MSEGVTTTVGNTLDPDEESRLTGEISDRWISGKMEAYFQKQCLLHHYHHHHQSSK